MDFIVPIVEEGITALLEIIMKLIMKYDFRRYKNELLNHSTRALRVSHVHGTAV